MYLYDKTATWRHHVLHNVRQIGRIEENRRVVVDIEDSDGDLGGIATRYLAYFRRAILAADR